MRTSRSMAAMTTALVLALSAGAGCANFPNITTVVDLRILGIMADPPEIYVDPATLSTQTDSFHSTITALVVDPQGAGRSISYDVLACGRDIDTVTAATGRNGVICQHNTADMPTNSYEVIPPDMQAGTPDGEGPEHDIEFDFAVAPSLLGQALAMDTAARQGFQLPVILQMELAAGSESIVATKRVIFSQQLPDRPPQAPNQNPKPMTITVYPARDADANPIAPMDLPDDKQPVGVPLNGQRWFEPVGTVAEAYSTRSATRDVPPQVVTTDVAAETLRFAFFATAGTFTPPETSTIRSLLRVDQDRVHLESQYTAPGTMPADPEVTIWIVAHDERGGASFTRRKVTLLPP